MSQLELVEKGVALAVKLERSPILVEEIAAMLGRAPLKAIAGSASALKSTESKLSEFAELEGLAPLPRAVGIPPLDGGFLPSGIYEAGWPDLIQRYGADPNRSKFLPGMFHALHDLKEGGIDKVHLGGSFPSAVERPNDFDLTFKGSFKPGMPRALAKVFNDRDLMKQAYGGECLEDHLAFFMRARCGKPIGVLELNTNSLPARVEKSPAYSIYDTWRAQNTKNVSFLDFLQRPRPEPEPFYSFSSPELNSPELK